MTLEHETVRARIIAVTLELMDEAGLELIKARTIARRVGVSVGTIYNLFGSVDELIQVANSHILADMNKLGQISVADSENELERRIDAGDIVDTPKDRLLFRLFALAKVYMDFVEDNANRWGAMLAFNRNQPEGSVAGWYLDQQNALFDLIGKVLDATPLGDEKAIRIVAARALWSAVHGIVTMNYVGQVSEQSRRFTWEQVELLVKLFVAGLYAESENEQDEKPQK
ncbi:MAG: TetR/AcrR family transcriptional regulator [Rhizobiaceae bacterium]|nr:TetR/AcrR family transcriptional regulator [Rhizobiaceae bacterium]